MIFHSRAALAEYALKNGADGVVISGCRHGDCFYRFGNHWMDLRVHGERKPVLRAKVDRSRITILGGADTDGKRLHRDFKAFQDSIASMKTTPSTATTQEANHDR